MEDFTPEHDQALLDRHWLVKNDATRTNYLLKFANLPDENGETCVILVTDTKRCWYEILTPRGILQRWRQCNPNNESSSPDANTIIQKLISVHIPSEFSDAESSVIESNEYDLSLQFNFALEWFWRWDLTQIGPRTAAELLSKHLIVPLILTNHVALQKVEASPAYSQLDWEKSVDATANHAKRSLTHQLKGAVSRPLFSDTLQRVTAGMHGIRSKNTEHSIAVKSTSHFAPVAQNSSTPSAHTPKQSTPKDNDVAMEISTPPLSQTGPVASSGEGPRKKLVRRAAGASFTASMTPPSLTPEIEKPRDTMNIDGEEAKGSISLSRKVRSPTPPSAAVQGSDSETEPEEDGEVVKKEHVKPSSSNTQGKSGLESTSLETKDEPPSKKSKVTEEDSDDGAAVNSASPKKKGPPVRQPVRRGGKRW